MADMKTTNIKGKEYVMVNERIKAFRNNFKDYRLITEILEISDKHCMMVAKVFNPAGEIVANGYARETVDKCPVNKFAFVENCETSAVGRALGMFGIGVDTAICSAEELNTKLSYEDKQEKQAEQKEEKPVEKKVAKKTEQVIEQVSKQPVEQATEKKDPMVLDFEKTKAKLESFKDGCFNPENELAINRWVLNFKKKLEIAYPDLARQLDNLYKKKLMK